MIVLIRLLPFFSLLALTFSAARGAELGAPEAADSEAFLRWHWYVDENRLAIEGFDPVAYHLDGEARVGSQDFEAVHRGVRYHFATESHRDFFTEEPESFLPAFGGWCALLMAADGSRGQAAIRFEPDPRVFKIVEGRLLLFGRGPNWNALEQWEQGDAPARLARADAFWRSREQLAAQIGAKPEGMHAQAPLETAQFDFIIGEWESSYSFRVSRATPGRAEMQGTWKAYYGWDGFAIYDDWSRKGGRPGNSGPAIRSFDPLTKKWVMHYIPINQPMATVWRLVGEFDDEGLHADMTGQDPDGTVFRQRVHFVDLTENSFTWRSDRSYDDGATWIEDWGLGKNVRAGHGGDH